MKFRSHARSSHLGELLSSPFERPRLVSRIIKYSYAIDAAVLLSAVAGENALAGHGAMSSFDTAIGVTLVFALLLRLSFKSLFGERQLIELVSRDKLLRIIVFILRISPILLAAFFVRLSIPAALAIGLFTFKILRELEKVFPRVGAGNLDRLQSAAKLMVILSFSPLVILRIVTIVVFIDQGEVTQFRILMVLGAMFAGLTSLFPRSSDFERRCHGCQQMAHRLVLRAFGLCEGCKRERLNRVPVV